MLDPLLEELAKRIVAQAKIDRDDAAYAGLLNYACYLLALKIIDIQFGELRYWIIATTVGTFHNIADELDRRMNGVRGNGTLPPYVPTSGNPPHKLDHLVDVLASKIVEQARELGGGAAYAGLLNYTCTRITLVIINLRFEKMIYWSAASKTFCNIADTFYKKKAIPYENLQIEKNGDVDLYEQFDAEMNQAT